MQEKTPQTSNTTISVASLLSIGLSQESDTVSKPSMKNTEKMTLIPGNDTVPSVQDTEESEEWEYSDDDKRSDYPLTSHNNISDEVLSDQVSTDNATSMRVEDQESIGSTEYGEVSTGTDAAVDSVQTEEHNDSFSNLKGIHLSVKIDPETGEKKSVAESMLISLKDSQKVNRAIGTGYRSIKRVVKGKQKQKKAKKERRIRQGYSQDAIPIKQIKNGIIQTSNGMFIKILEVLPINFSDMSITKHDRIARIFASIFNEGPSQIHMKCICDKNNPSRMIAHIKQKCEEEKWQRGVSDGFIECAEDLIKKIKSISSEATVSRRYFFIYRYEGTSSDPQEIWTDLETTKCSIVRAFSECGNSVVEYELGKSSYEIGEILYSMLNRKTCRTESFQERIGRMMGDVDFYNSTSKKQKIAVDMDFLAPKGLTFNSQEYAMIDGQYVTYFALKEDGHPGRTYIGWLDLLMAMGDGVDLDIYINRKNHDTTYSALSQYARVQTVNMNTSQSSSKRENLVPKILNKNYITEHMGRGENLFDVVIIISIRADSIMELRQKKQFFLKDMATKKLYMEDAYGNVRKYFNMTLPLFEVAGDIFRRNKRNYLTSSLGSLYMFTSFEFNDYTGAPLGQNAMIGNLSLVTINPFNTAYFTNANMTILGATGAGKTYTQNIIARSLRISLCRIFLIIPLKGHESYKGCMHIGGSFIHLYPGSKDCINICEIRPEANIDRDELHEESSVTSSLLSGQISYLLTWINLNLKDKPMSDMEHDLVQTELYTLYNRFGITHDNDSIYDKNGEIKFMPIIGDIYDRLVAYPELDRITKALSKYVFGNCSNLNGPTNVDLDNKFIVFYVDENNIPEDLLPSFFYIPIKCTYGLVKQNRLSLDTIIIEEAWKLMKYKEAALEIKEMVKVIRGYGGSICITTQDIDDLLADETGRAVVYGTAIKFIMYMEEPQARKVADNLGLNDEDVDRITSFEPGQAMLLTRHAKICINILPSAMEDRDFTTDPNKLKHYAEIEQKKANSTKNSVNVQS